MDLYFVDYENINGDSFYNILNELDKENSQIHIFYTENNKKFSIPFEFINSFNGENFISHKSATGKQALDKLLVSFLGYLIGKDNDKSNSYHIISNDKGYVDVIEFWKDKYEINVNLIGCNKAKPIKETENTDKPKRTRKKSAAKKEPNSETELNKLIDECRKLPEKERKKKFNAGCVKIYGQKEGNEKYKSNLEKIK